VNNFFNQSKIAAKIGFSSIFLLLSSTAGAATVNLLPIQIQVDGFGGAGTLALDFIGFDADSNGVIDDVDSDGLLTLSDLYNGYTVSFGEQTYNTNFQYGIDGTVGSSDNTLEYMENQIAINQPFPLIDGPLSDLYFDVDCCAPNWALLVEVTPDGSEVSFTDDVLKPIPNYQYTSTSDPQLSFPSPVPIPASIVLFASGLLALTRIKKSTSSSRSL
jgi:hypothetical protein